MDLLARTFGYVIGVVYWMYLRFPRHDVERRSSPRYRKALSLTKSIWIVSGCIMVVLMTAFPAVGFALSMAQALLTTCLCYMILDEIE
jgi:hypothetical protein